MVKFNLVQELSSFKSIPYGSVVLWPFAEKALSREDLSNARVHGLVVLDVSWGNIDAVPKLKKSVSREHCRTCWPPTRSTGASP